jgi:hypothetical protein
MNNIPAGYVLVRPKMISDVKVIGRSEHTKPDGIKKSRNVTSVDVGYFDEDGNLVYQYTVHSNIAGKIW